MGHTLWGNIRERSWLSYHLVGNREDSVFQQSTWQALVPSDTDHRIPSTVTLHGRDYYSLSKISTWRFRKAK